MHTTIILSLLGICAGMLYFGNAEVVDQEKLASEYTAVIKNILRKKGLVGDLDDTLQFLHRKVRRVERRRWQANTYMYNQEQLIPKLKKTLEDISKKYENVVCKLAELYKVRRTPRRSSAANNKTGSETDLSNGTSSSKLETGPKHMSALLKRQSKGIAFSTYLKHSVNKMKPETVIKFDGIFINKGKAYNRREGVFTAPTRGTYLFTFYFGTFRKHAKLNLMVNGKMLVNAIAEPPRKEHRMMGSNTAIVRLEQGDRVWIESGDNVESGRIYSPGKDGDGRYATFSGAFLY